jgi:hypothetical protein
MFQMVRDKTWMLKAPPAKDLRGIFISKSSWYAGYQLFAKLDKNSDMKKWLEGDSDMENAELWGKDKGRYTFTDLRKYLEENRDVEKVRGKVKGKEKVKEKRKAAGSVSEGSKKEKKKKKKAQIDENSS